MLLKKRKGVEMCPRCDDWCVWQQSGRFALFYISSDKHVACVPACMPDSRSIFVRHLRACVCSMCAHIYVFLCIYIHLSHCDIRNIGWVQLITTGAKPRSRLSDQHKASCPSCFTLPDPSVWPLCSEDSCQPHKLHSTAVLSSWNLPFCNIFCIWLQTHCLSRTANALSCNVYKSKTINHVSLNISKGSSLAHAYMFYQVSWISGQMFRSVILITKRTETIPWQRLWTPMISQQTGGHWDQSNITIKRIVNDSLIT